MAEAVKWCHDVLQIEVGNGYDFHDAPPSVELLCYLRKGHYDLHECEHNGQQIKWARIEPKLELIR